MKLSTRTPVLRPGGKTGWEVYFEAIRRQRDGADITILAIGEHDFVTDEVIVGATVEALHAGDHHYTDYAGRPPLREAIAREMTRITGVATSPEECIYTCGSQSALFTTAQCILDAGDEAMIFEPYYNTYHPTLAFTGAHVTSIPCRDDGSLLPDLAALDAAITDRTRLMLINTPNNPSGCVYDRPLLEALAERCIAHDIWLLSDEVYATMCDPGAFLSPRVLKGMKDRTVIASGLSKSHAMTGWRCGWAVGPEHLIEAMVDMSSIRDFGLPSFIQEGAVAALAQMQIPDRIADIYRERRRIVVHTLGDIEGIPVVRPDTGMNVLIDTSAISPDAEQVAMRLLDDTGIACLPATSFGPSVAGMIRLSLSSDVETLACASHRIRDWLLAQSLA